MPHLLVCPMNMTIIRLFSNLRIFLEFIFIFARGGVTSLSMSNEHDNYQAIF